MARTKNKATKQPAKGKRGSPKDQPGKLKIPFVKLEKRKKELERAFKKITHLTIDANKLAQEAAESGRKFASGGGCTAAMPGKHEACVLPSPFTAPEDIRVDKGEPFPQTLVDLVHEAAQKAAQEIIQKRDEMAKASVTSMSPREAYENCYRYLSMLSMDGQNAVVGRLLNDLEQGRQQELDAHLHRAQELDVRTRSLQHQVHNIQNVKHGAFTVLNL